MAIADALFHTVCWAMDEEFNGFVQSRSLSGRHVSTGFLDPVLEP